MREDSGLYMVDASEVIIPGGSPVGGRPGIDGSRFLSRSEPLDPSLSLDRHHGLHTPERGSHLSSHQMTPHQCLQLH